MEVLGKLAEEHGVIVNAKGTNSIGVHPSLIVKEKHVDELIHALKDVVA